MYQNFIGIDIGKFVFCAAVHGQKETKTFSNSPEGFEQFCHEFRNHLPQALIVLETTGGYEIKLIAYLQQHHHSLHRANTRKVKHFIRSFGQLGKSDAIDALVLARYGHERHEQLELYVENKGKTLLKLVQRRNDLKQMLVQEKNRLKAPDQEGLLGSFQTVIHALEEEITQIEQRIEAASMENPDIKAQKEVLKTVPGIGDVVSIQLLALLPELGKLDRRKIASLAGVAPHPNESGQKIGYRFTRGGRSDVKPVLFMAALTASRSHTPLGDFYRKLIEAGKKKMVALTALMRKILVIANARLRDFFDNKEPLST